MNKNKYNEPLMYINDNNEINKQNKVSSNRYIFDSRKDEFINSIQSKVYITNSDLLKIRSLVKLAHNEIFSICSITYRDFDKEYNIICKPLDIDNERLIVLEDKDEQNIKKEIPMNGITNLIILEF